MTILDDQNNPTNEVLSPLAIAQLQKSAGWATFLGVIASLILFGGVIFIILSGNEFFNAYQNMKIYDTDHFYSVQAILMGSVCTVLIIGVVLGSVVTFALFSYANAVNQFMASKSSLDLEKAFLMQNQAMRYFSYVFMVAIVFVFGMAIVLSSL